MRGRSSSPVNAFLWTLVVGSTLAIAAILIWFLVLNGPAGSTGTPGPTPDPTAERTPGTTSEPTTDQSGDGGTEITLRNDVTFVIPDGWRITQQREGYLRLAPVGAGDATSIRIIAERTHNRAEAAWELDSELGKARHGRVDNAEVEPYELGQAPAGVDVAAKRITGTGGLYYENIHEAVRYAMVSINTGTNSQAMVIATGAIAGEAALKAAFDAVASQIIESQA